MSFSEPCPFCAQPARATGTGVQKCPSCGRHLLALGDADGGEPLHWLPGEYGRFRLVAPARPGGVRLFRAEERPGGRPAAVRIFPEYAELDVAGRERLDREIGVLQGTTHPNLARVVDQGTESGVRWYAREWIEGDDLAAVLGDLRSGNRTMPFEYALPYFKQLCGALQALHDRGLAHGSVRPEQVILGTDRNLKLTDPDLLPARSMGAAITSEPAGDRRDPYLAPERLADRRVRDVRSDIFETGLVTHELLAGFLPGAIVRRVSVVNATVPAGFDQLLIAMLQPDPALRPPAIGPLAEGKRAPGPGAPGEAPNLDRVANAAGGLVAGALIGGIAVWKYSGGLWTGVIAGGVAGLLAGALLGRAPQQPVNRPAPPRETGLTPAAGRSWAPPAAGGRDTQEGITRKDT